MSAVPIVALDVADLAAALEIADALGQSCRFYKVGSELFTACGPKIVRELRAREADVFLDLKLHDIPNTVAGGLRRAAALGARIVTVHAAGGEAMIRAAVQTAATACAVFAVTLLTSLDGSDVARIWGRSEPLDVGAEVVRLAGIAHSGGATGVVCSGREARAVKARFGSSLEVLIPGIRLAGGQAHDQSRTVTPADAVAAGADYVVVGRAVTAAPDRVSAMREILSQLG
ncbi:MAG TPA: orotidine-5'-phosphate decarboxylase [Gemmatimonadaceae bacterium]|nr:orotidine-5'-phosphate decarboxylase [Gemmatimonadaceae bacterium]